MRKSFQLPVIAVCAFSLWTFSSCKKNENDPVCKLKTVTTASGTSTSLITLSYNGDGKISMAATTSASGNSSTLFTYSGNTINVVNKDNLGITTGSYDVTLNSAGKIATVLEKDALGVLEETTTYMYDGNNNLSSVTNKPTTGTQTVSIVTYTNGNLMSFTSGTDVTSLDYYMDKSFQDGDYLKLFQLLQYGAFFITNNNLMKSINTGGSSSSLATYEMDNTGKISKMTLSSGGSNTTYNYTYECK